MVRTRHTWFVEFEQEFQRHAAGFLATRVDAVKASEGEWRVWLHEPGIHARTVSIDLPPNYALFQPAAVAVNTALRLRDVCDEPVSTTHLA